MEFNSLEGRMELSAGDILVRGEAGEFWPVSRQSIAALYESTGEIDEDGWQRHLTRDRKGVLAAQVDHPFRLQSPWGELSGKAGDFIVKHRQDRDVQYPEDVWIVDQTVFGATY